MGLVAIDPIIIVSNLVFLHFLCHFLSSYFAFCAHPLINY